MELFMTYLPHRVSEPDVVEAVAGVLHRSPLAASHANPVNFSVNVFSNRNKRDGKISTSANITVADADLAQRFLDTYGSPRPGLRVKGIQTRTFFSKRPLDPLRLAEVRANPFVSPTTERARVHELQQLKEPIPLTRVEFGRVVKRGNQDVFSSEWEKAVAGGGNVYLDGSTRLLVVDCGSSDAPNLLIPVASISQIQELRSTTSILLSLNHPPTYHKRPYEGGRPTSSNVFDLADLVSSLLGKQASDRRTSALDAEHSEIAPFCSTQIVLTFPSQANVHEFKHRRSQTLRMPHVKTVAITVQKLGCYSGIGRLRAGLAKLSIPVAFQLEMLLHSEILDVSQLLELTPTLNQLEAAHGPEVTEQVLQQLGNRQTDARSESWDHDETEEWYEGADFDDAKPFDRSTFTSKRGRQGSDFSGDLRLQLKHLATRLQPLLESSLFVSRDSFLCRHAILTPSRIVLEGPFPDDSNSIIRRYPSHADNFLRVSIREEDGTTLSHSKEVNVPQFLRERFAPFFKSDGGLDLAGRQFEFLGYSQSALREHSTWFVAPFESEGKKVTAATIRDNLGDFSSVITIPARYMARLSQAFTTTQPSLILEPHQIVEIPDLYSPSGSCFTDGVGKISPALAAEVEAILKAARPSKRLKEKSTCYQFRLGGAKGMLAVDPSLRGKVVHLRKSQIKFEGRSFELDIADTFGRPLPCYLNRPLIKILEDLGIPASTFRVLQDDAVARVHKATTSLREAASLLDRTGLGGPAKLASLWTNLGTVLKLKPADLDPFLKHCEGLAVAEALKSIKFKARISLPTCVTLVGVADEDGWLREGEIYACVKRPDQDPFYVDGDVCISRSPSIHPGDVQVVTAVGEIPEGVAPRLRGLVNCVVFSVRGNRSLPSCLGGGDLDGDIYQLITLPKLIPDRSKLAQPAAYPPPRMNRLDRPATIDDGVDFLLGYITSDLMGQVASRHLQLSDYYPEGTRHPECIELAQVHSDAVDYPKTGTPVDMRSLPKSPSQHKPQFMCGEYWAHQQRGEGKLYYTSDKSLGQLFRAIPLKDIKLVSSASHSLESLLLDSSSTITDALLSAFTRANLGRLPPRSLDAFDPDLVRQVRTDLDEFCFWFNHYATINTLSNRPDRYLSESEVVLGTLATPARNPRLRQDKAARLQRQTEQLFDWVRRDVVGLARSDGDEDDENDDESEVEVIERCWVAWLVAKEAEEWFGVKSFGFVVLQVLLDLLRRRHE